MTDRGRRGTSDSRPVPGATRASELGLASSAAHVPPSREHACTHCACQSSAARHRATVSMRAAQPARAACGAVGAWVGTSWFHPFAAAALLLVGRLQREERDHSHHAEDEGAHDRQGVVHPGVHAGSSVFPRRFSLEFAENSWRTRRGSRRRRLGSRQRRLGGTDCSIGRHFSCSRSQLSG